MAKKPKNGKSKSEIQLCCETCGAAHTTMKLGELAEKVPDFDPKQKNYRHGMCAKCKAELEEGCTFFVDSKGRCVKVSAEASREKISEGFRCKVIKIPVPALSELVRVYLQSNSKPPK